MGTLGLALFFGSFALILWIDHKIKDPKIGDRYYFKDLPAFKMCADPEDGLQPFCYHIAHYNFLKGICAGMAGSGFLMIWLSLG